MTSKRTAPSQEDFICSLYFSNVSLREIAKQVRGTLSHVGVLRLIRRRGWDKQKEALANQTASEIRKQQKHTLRRYEQTLSLMLNMASEEVEREIAEFWEETEKYKKGERADPAPRPAWMIPDVKNFKVFGELLLAFSNNEDAEAEKEKDSPRVTLSPSQASRMLAIMAENSYPIVEDKIYSPPAPNRTEFIEDVTPSPTIESEPLQSSPSLPIENEPVPVEAIPQKPRQKFTW